MTAPVDAPTVEVGPEVDGEIPLTFPVVVIEGLDTSDGRYLEPGSLTHRALPISLLAQPESSHGGDEPGPSVVIGRIDTLERKPGPEVISKRTGQPFPVGTFVWVGTGAMFADNPVAELVRRRYLRGVSVDLTGMDYEVVGDEGFDADPEHPRRQLVTYAAEIAAATLVPIPAFGDAYVEIGADPMTADDVPADLVASASPAWRSPEVGDPATLPALAAAAGHTGGMIALVPANAGELTVDGGEPAEELHLTLAYLGDDVTGWSDEQRDEVLQGAQAIAEALGRPTTAEIMGHAAFNPTGANDREPCAVYLVSGDDLPALKGEASAFDASEHPVFLPHITAGYGLSPAELAYVGPVTFDRLRVALADDVHDFPLGDAADGDTDEPEEGAMADQPTTPDAPDTELTPDGVGMPDAPQPCQYGDHPAAMSLLFGDDQYVPVCADHEPEARDQIEAAGGEVTGVVEIADDGDNEADDEPEPDAEPVVAAGYQRPPADWFADPQLDGPTPLHVGEDGRVYGHLAVWNVAHIGMPGRQVFAPRSQTSYAYFRTGAVLADDGTEIAVGHITMDTGHAGTDLGRHAAAAHYDHTGAVVADVAAGEDEHGIWVAGALRSNVDEETVARLRASALSGDWRRVGSSLELVAALAVNTPGFPIPRARVASGAPLALVAAGVLRPETEPPIESLSVGKLTVGDLAASSVISVPPVAGARIEVDPNGAMRWYAASGELIGSTAGAPTAPTPATLAAQIDAALARRERQAELAAKKAALLAQVDDTADRQAALVAALDDTGERQAALLAALADDEDDDEAAVAELARIAAEEGMTEDEFLSRMPEQLRESYLRGKVAARIGWGTPGDFDRCVAQARHHGVPAHMRNGMCATLHKQATGEVPGKH